MFKIKRKSLLTSIPMMALAAALVVPPALSPPSASPSVPLPAAVKVAAKKKTCGTACNKKAAAKALSKRGKPYRWGGTGPNSFDCSGLAVWSYRQAGYSIPRTSQQQYKSLKTKAYWGRLKPGDLLFFYSGPSHVGIYLGKGWMVHASSRGKPVAKIKIGGKGANYYYKRNFKGARRP